MLLTLATGPGSSLRAGFGDTNGNKNTHFDTSTVYIDTSMPVESLATTQVLQDLLFGDLRITSSPDFLVGVEASETYASAVEIFKKYGNTRIGENVTLAPSFFMRMPFVVSMNCPELGICDVVTDFSGTRSHERFGPNHTTRITEVMSKLVPFVNQCCEVAMGLDSSIVEDLVEDHDMPIATSGVIEHCFAHNPTYGVIAYVSAHDFVLPTSILNTHNALDGNSPEGT